MSARPSQYEMALNEHISPPVTGDNITAKKVAPYYWDGSNWQRTPAPAGFDPHADITTTISGDVITQTDGTRTLTTTISGTTITEVWT